MPRLLNVSTRYSPASSGNPLRSQASMGHQLAASSTMRSPLPASLYSTWRPLTSASAIPEPVQGGGRVVQDLLLDCFRELGVLPQVLQALGELVVPVRHVG